MCILSRFSSLLFCSAQKVAADPRSLRCAPAARPPSVSPFNCRAVQVTVTLTAVSYAQIDPISSHPLSSYVLYSVVCALPLPFGILPPLLPLLIFLIFFSFFFFLFFLQPPRRIHAAPLSETIR